MISHEAGIPSSRSFTSGDIGLASSDNKLSAQDIAVLKSDPSEEVRAGIAEKVALQASASSLTQEERALAHSILSTMVHDAAERVRVSLSESLKHAQGVPHDVAMALAKDIDSVSVPMLENSPVFTDEDLVEIIQSGAANKQVAIASRSSVSDNVAGALVSTDNGQAVAVLASNEGAQMSDQTLSSMLERHASVEGVTESLAQRSDLPVNVAERLTAHVSDELQSVLMKRYELSKVQAKNLASASRERATVDLVDQVAGSSDVLALARQLSENGRLTPSLILRSLCTGDIRFFEAAISVLAKLMSPKFPSWFTMQDSWAWKLYSSARNCPRPTSKPFAWPWMCTKKMSMMAETMIGSALSSA